MSPLLAWLVISSAVDGGVPPRPVQINAPKATFLKREGRGVYSGGVTVVRDTLTLTCDELEGFFVGDDLQRVVARGHVVAVDGDRQAWGDEAEFFNDTGELVVRGHPRGKQGPREVEGTLVNFTTGVDRLIVTQARSRTVDRASTVTIDADRLTMEGLAHEALWTGHVRATKDRVVLLAPELRAAYDQAGEVTRVRASGGVEVTEDARWAQGQLADYDVPRGLLVVTGKPQARDGTTRMKGTQVTFFTGTERLEVENATTVFEADRKKVP